MSPTSRRTDPGVARELRLDLTSLSGQGRARRKENLAPEVLQDCLAGQGRLLGDAVLDVDLQLFSGRVTLQGTLTGLWELECPRCLARASRPYEAKVAGAFAAKTAGREAFEEVRQALILAIPLRPYCRENCKGLCPRCGVDRNEKTCECEISSNVKERSK